MSEVPNEAAAANKVHEASPGLGLERKKESLPLDLVRILKTLKRTWYVLPLLLFFSLAGAYLIVRYTLPVYESTSMIRLNQGRNEGNVLNIKNFFNSINYNTQDADISLLRSKLFLAKVAQNLKYKVSYYKGGNIVNSEIYKNSPFIVRYEAIHPAHRETIFSLRVLDDTRCKVGIRGKKSVEGYFGELINVEGQFINVHKTALFIPNGQYFFKLNSDASVIAYLQKSMTARLVNKTITTIQVTFKEYHPYKARDMLFALDTTYIQFLADMKSSIIERGLSFVETQLATVNDNIKQRENYFEDFILREKTTNVSEELRKSIKELNNINERIRRDRQQVAYLDTLVRQSNGSALLTANPAYKLPDELLTSIDAFNVLSQKDRASAISYKEGSYVVTLHKQQLALVRAQIQEHARTYRDFLSTSLGHALLERLRAEQKIKRLPSLSNVYQQNRRLYALDEQFYLSLVRKKVELKVAQASSQVESVLISEPNLPMRPISPNKPIFYGGAIMVSIGFYVLIFAVYYLLSNSIQDARTLRRLSGMPVLGSLPIATYLQVGELVEPTTPFYQGLLSIKGAVNFFALHSQRKLIMITSVLPKEGKTTLAFHLASLFGHQGRRTLFIDFNLEQPSLYGLLQKEACTGMSALLKGDSPLEKMIYCHPQWTFDYLSVGVRPIDPLRLVTHERLDKLLSLCKAQYDVLIMDTVAISMQEVSNLVLAKKADFLLCTVHAKQSKSKHIELLCDFLHRSQQEEHLGLVLNAQLLNHFVQTNGN